MMHIRYRRAAAALLFVLAADSVIAGPAIDEERLARGRYVIQIGGCNDCHTPGYIEREGQVPESEWLLGDALGWRGPWGTTYAPNLRLSLSHMSEDQWVAFARKLRSRPPMPSFNLNHVSEADLRAIYAFVRSLQPLGEPAPAYLPPDREPPMPFVSFPIPPSE